jgi:hypothetical protein
MRAACRAYMQPHCTFTCKPLTLCFHLCKLLSLCFHLCKLLSLCFHLCKLLALCFHLCKPLTLCFHLCKPLSLCFHLCKPLTLCFHLWNIVLSSATNVHFITSQDRALVSKSLSHHAGDADAGARAGICNGVRDGSERDRITSCHHHLQHTTATLRQRRDCEFTRRHHPVDRRLLLAARCFVWCWWLPRPSPSRLRGWTSSEMRVPI